MNISSGNQETDDTRPSTRQRKQYYSSVTQLAECLAVNQNVGGSSPPWRAIQD